jgi:hypothetical protein
MGLTSVATNYAGGPVAGAWNAILGDSNFQLGYNYNTGNLMMVTNGGNGNFAYSASTFPLSGSPIGNITEYVVAWLAADGSTPSAAALAGAPVGWSAPFNYLTTSSIGTPLTLANSGFVGFGVAPVPEPSTLALAGLGGLSLLLFRRRR